MRSISSVENDWNDVREFVEISSIWRRQFEMFCNEMIKSDIVLVLNGWSTPCAEKGVVSWNAKLMVGKAVDKSIATCINCVQLKNDAMKVHKVLQMETLNQETDTQVEDLRKVLSTVENENTILKIGLDSLHKQVGRVSAFLSMFIENTYMSEFCERTLQKRIRNFGSIRRDKEINPKSR